MKITVWRTKYGYILQVPNLSISHQPNTFSASFSSLSERTSTLHPDLDSLEQSLHPSQILIMHCSLFDALVLAIRILRSCFAALLANQEASALNIFVWGDDNGATCCITTRYGSYFFTHHRVGNTSGLPYDIIGEAS
jgi:hypothetical protein